jgi:hypothetical protein
MIGRIKAFCLGFIAIAALGAAAASTVQAGHFGVGATPAVVTGNNDEKGGVNQTVTLTLKTKSGLNFQAVCQAGTFEGTVQGQKVEEATVTPTYGTATNELQAQEEKEGKKDDEQAQGCQLGGAKAQVLMNGCKYTLTGNAQAANTAAVDIVGCTVGKQIEIINTTPGCIVAIPEQNGLSHMVGVNETAQDVTLEATVGGIKTQQIQVGAPGFCPDGNNFTAINAQFAANTTVKAFQDPGTFQQVTRHTHQYNILNEGAQIAIQST